MGDDLRHDLSPVAGEPIDPVKMARRDLKKALPRRFYREVTVAAAENGFGPHLDGKAVRTPAKALFSVPTLDLAEAVAAEWRAQTEYIEPDTMPLTRLVNSAIDGVANALDATVAEVVKFAETDLVCYRAGDPEPLVTAQSEAWDPILAFARSKLGARFMCSEGILFVEQPESARRAVGDAVAAIASGPAGALRLAAFSVMTSLTGSVLIGLAVVGGMLTPEAAWSASLVDEDYQTRFWGIDAEALARRERRWRDMQAAAQAYRLSAA